MRQFRGLLTCVTVCMLAILLHLTVVSCYLGAGDRAVTDGAEVAQAQGASGHAGDAAGQQSFKPPKHAFVDYSDFLLVSVILPPDRASVSRLLGHEVSGSPPEVYLDIFIPPDRTA